MPAFQNVYKKIISTNVKRIRAVTSYLINLPAEWQKYQNLSAIYMLKVAQKLSGLCQPAR